MEKMKAAQAWIKEKRVQLRRKYQFLNLRFEFWLKEQAEKLRFLKIDLKEMVKKCIPQKYEAQAEEKYFLYLIQYSPNPNFMSVHMRVRVPEGGNFMSARRSDSHPMHTALSDIRGVISTYSSSIDAYEVRVEKGEIFTWDELNPHVIEAIRVHLANGKSMKESGKAKYPSKAELAHVEMMVQVSREEELEEARGDRSRSF